MGEQSKGGNAKFALKIPLKMTWLNQNWVFRLIGIQNYANTTLRTIDLCSGNTVGSLQMEKLKHIQLLVIRENLDSPLP